MAEFAYNNTKNISTSHTRFELNYGYYSYVLFKEDVDPWSRSIYVGKLLLELQKLMSVCCTNLFHAQKL